MAVRSLPPQRPKVQQDAQLVEKPVDASSHDSDSPLYPWPTLGQNRRDEAKSNISVCCKNAVMKIVRAPPLHPPRPFSPQPAEPQLSRRHSGVAQRMRPRSPRPMPPFGAWSNILALRLPISTGRTLVDALDNRIGRLPTYLPSICFQASRKSSGSEKARKAYLDWSEKEGHGQRRDAPQLRSLGRRTLFESRSLTTLVFLNEGYLEKASVRTFSVQSLETSETNSRNHFGSHSTRVGLRGRRAEGSSQEAEQHRSTSFDSSRSTYSSHTLPPPLRMTVVRFPLTLPPPSSCGG